MVEEKLISLGQVAFEGYRGRHAARWEDHSESGMWDLSAAAVVRESDARRLCTACRTRRADWNVCPSCYDAALEKSRTHASARLVEAIVVVRDYGNGEVAWFGDWSKADVTPAVKAMLLHLQTVLLGENQ